MSTDLTPRIIFPGTGIATGEILDLSDIDQVARWSHELSSLWGQIMQMKRAIDDALRDQLAAGGQTSMIVAGGDYEVAEEPGKATYDGELLYTGLVAAGIDPDVVAQMFRPELRDARELGKLERRNDAVAKAAEAARTRGRGRIKVKRKRPPAGAPTTPAYVREAVAEQARDQADARARGI